MEFFENPLDISKDGKNDFMDGIRYYIRESEKNKEEIKKYYINNKYRYCSAEYTPQEILNEILDNLNINLSCLTIANERELLDYILVSL